MGSGSTLAQRALGRELRRLRNVKGVGQSQAARIAETSHQTIGRIEEGQTTRITMLQVNALCDSYGATEEERRICLDLVKEIRASREGKMTASWWRAYADAQTTGFDHYLALEDAVDKLTIWQLMIVPGLLQTREYRRAIAWTESPNLPTEQMERRIEWQTYRQERLKDPDLHITAFLSEAVLRDQIGGKAVIADQLRQLIALADRPNIVVRVAPFAAGPHVGRFAGSFTLLEFPAVPSGLVPPPIVYSEGYAGDLYLEREAEVQRYQRVVHEIGRVALDEAKSKTLMSEICKEHSR